MAKKPFEIMGILNLTPDSFFDGNSYFSIQQAVDAACTMVEQGADLIDIGGESTRPGARSIPASEEINRVIPVIEALKRTVHVPLSIDTRKTQVMQTALQAGASMVNDINALRDDGAIDIIRQHAARVCIMHIQGEPQTMQQQPRYDDVVREVYDFLQDRVKACLAGGIAANKLIIDIGFGFGKTTQHNLSLLNNLVRFKALNCPLLVGLSRKATIGQVLQQPLHQRMLGSVAANVVAFCQGATVFRVHDVQETAQALSMAAAIQGADS